MQYLIGCETAKASLTPYITGLGVIKTPAIWKEGFGVSHTSRQLRVDKRFCQEEHFADIWSAEGLGKPAPRPGFTNPNLSRGLVQSRMSQILTIIMGVICVCRWDLLGAGASFLGIEQKLSRVTRMYTVTDA